MIRKLRLKFMAIFMTLVTLVLLGVSVSIYSSAERSVEAASREVLQRVILEADRSTTAPVFPSLGPVQLPYFTVNVTVHYWPVRTYTARVVTSTYGDLSDTAELEAVLSSSLSQPQAEGVVPGYDLRYLRQTSGQEIQLAFVDMSSEQAVLSRLMRSYLQIALAAFLLLLGVSVLLARWATAPVERAWRQQRQFLSDASHELKTPLTVILSNAELLEAAPLEERTARWADNIHSEAGRMKKLVEEMLTLARADNMVRTNVMTEVSLSDTVEDCVLAFEPVAFEAGKVLESHIAENVVVIGDQDKLRQVVSVLLDNAIKYGAEGGTITLTLQKTDRQARLIVSNPGEPIPPEQLRRLFERFYRADASRGEQSGFGLGLSIASVIADEHKGTLKAESDAVSTRFLFTMPVKK